MELYILDGLLRRTTVVDKYESLIWTERFKDIGDFEMLVFSTVDNRRLFTVGLRVTVNDSDRVMEIETVDDAEDSEGRSMITIRGRSLEYLLENRVARNTFASLTTTPKWLLTGTPGGIARAVFDAICRDNTLMAEDEIPFLQTGTLYPAGTIDEPDEVYDMEIEPATVYSVTKQIAETYTLGFRLVRNNDESELYYEIYSGSDRTTQQSSVKPVIFSRALDNLTNTSEYTSIANLKNVAYVYSANGVEIVYADGTTSTVEGFDRKVLMVKADDIDLAAGPELTAALQRRGKEELAKHRSLSAFDGEIPQFNSYKYRVDYDLGDLVEMRNVDGATNQMRVTEQIRASDINGERSYPTLATDLFIIPGTWLAWDYNQVWADADGTWSEAS